MVSGGLQVLQRDYHQDVWSEERECCHLVVGGDSSRQLYLYLRGPVLGGKGRETAANSWQSYRLVRQLAWKDLTLESQVI